MKRNRICTSLTFIFLSFVIWSISAEEFGYSIILERLKEAGAVAYSHKENYSKVIPDMYLGYDKDGNVVVGIAIRKIRTYKKVTALLMVRRKEDVYFVDYAYILDIDIIKDKEKRNKVASSIEDISGKVLIDSEGKHHGVDTVTGATRYYKNMYAYYNLLSRHIIKEMKNNPDWAQLPLPQ